MKPCHWGNLVGTLVAVILVSFSVLGWAAAVVKQDFNGDLKDDILWLNSLTGEKAVWLMNGAAVGTAALTTTVADTTWTVAGIGDFDGDGKADILLRNTVTGDNAIWQMNGAAVTSPSLITPIADTHWAVAGIGDFNGDGKADILWRNVSTGENAVWLMNGSSILGSAYITPISDLNWTIVGVGDFVGGTPSKSDILWRNTATGENAIWFMDGSAVTSSTLINAVDTSWVIAGVGDYNADGKADILWRQPGTGQNAIWLMNGSVMTSSALIQAAPSDWEIIGAGDYNGDGKSDILWRNKSTGDNAVWLMNGFTLASSALITAVVDFTWLPMKGGADAQIAGQVQNLFGQLKSIANGNGNALTDANLAPLFDVNYLQDGVNATIRAGQLASDLRGATLNSIGVTAVNFNAVNRTAKVRAVASLTQNGTTSTQLLKDNDDVCCARQQSNGSWKFYGNQRIAEANPQVEIVTSVYTGFVDGPRQNLNIDVRAPQNGGVSTVSAVSFTGGGQTNLSVPKSSGTETVIYSPTPTTMTSYIRDTFFNGFSPLGTVTSGTKFTTTVTRASDNAQFSYDTVVRGVATNPITGAVTVTSPNSHVLSSITFGSPTTFVWTLPTAYTISRVKLGGYVRTATSPNPGTQCQLPDVSLAPNATTGQITIPATCSGVPVLEVGVNVNVDGVMDERSTYIYGYQ